MQSPAMSDPVLERIDSLIRRGELLAAYDSAIDALERSPDVLALKHRVVLCLVRAGALEQAREEYARLDLDTVTDDEDILALGGRLLKAVALEARGEERRLLAAAAARKYALAYERTGGAFPGINTASLSLVAGHADHARALARAILKDLPHHHPGTGEEAYYHGATRAEALLLLGRRTEAEDALKDAIASDPKNYSAHATTLNQLAMILQSLDEEGDWLDLYRPPKSAHFAGHMFAAEEEQTPSFEGRLREAVEEAIAAEGIGFGYGACAAGADIVIAEALLDAGAELHLVQPCPDDAFAEFSLRPFGEAWLSRFNACRRRAATIRYMTTEQAVSDGLDLAMASRVAMGQAILRAESLATKALQLAIWDGRPHRHLAGTSHDVECWRKTGLKQIIFPYGRQRQAAGGTTARSNRQSGGSVSRTMMAMLFADTHGFGRLGEYRTAAFVETVLRSLADCSKRLKAPPVVVNTWGDGLFLAFPDVGDAAEAAIALQERFRSIDLESAGLPSHLSLRIGCHYGPVQEHTDPFLDRPNIFGSQVVIASRIESVTVPGSIYVSEPFASILAAMRDRPFHCDYVGRSHLRAGLEGLPLFSLRRDHCFHRYPTDRQVESERRQSSGRDAERQALAFPGR